MPLICGPLEFTCGAPPLASVPPAELIPPLGPVVWPPLSAPPPVRPPLEAPPLVDPPLPPPSPLLLPPLFAPAPPELPLGSPPTDTEPPLPVPPPVADESVSAPEPQAAPSALESKIQNAGRVKKAGESGLEATMFAGQAITPRHRPARPEPERAGRLHRAKAASKNSSLAPGLSLRTPRLAKPPAVCFTSVRRESLVGPQQRTSNPARTGR